jgi:hypothetical protein
MASLPTQFAQLYAPLLWEREFAMYGRTVLYHQESFDPAVAVELNVVWKEGRAGEEVSPGRYSHILIQNADLDTGPIRGDIVEDTTANKFFDVVSVEADPNGYSRAILREQGLAY